MTERSFAGIELAVLIGGGPHMVVTAEEFAGHGIACSAILAPRHADQSLPESGNPLSDALAETCEQVEIVDDINGWPGLKKLITNRRAVALCFGPSWIFRRAVRAQFALGMINFNGIPIPRFLGGAHFTWQILLDDRTGGCFFQEISDVVDRGPILRSERYSLPPEVRLPNDYERKNFERAREFLKNVIADMVSGAAFVAEDFAPLNLEREYYPRLQTSLHGYIDWSWTADEICRFCCSFDAPYPGAGTFLGDDEVRLTDVRPAGSWPTKGHPFVAGLVIRKLDSQIWIAARDGWLSVGHPVFPQGQEESASVREGDRFHTPRAVLDRAFGTRAQLSSKGFKGSEGE